ncbi:MAG TPA: hypothetical protein VGE01_06825 [Fimbriimonas sp.]
MVRIFLSAFSAAALACGVMALQQQGEAPSPPDMTSPKAFPNGCVGCHAKTPAGDHRLSVALGKTHADALKQVKNVPADCSKCHRPGTKLVPMNTLLHKLHYAEQGFFTTGFGGQCLHCHKMDPATGKVTLKSGPRNW